MSNKLNVREGDVIRLKPMTVVDVDGMDGTVLIDSTYYRTIGSLRISVLDIESIVSRTETLEEKVERLERENENLIKTRDLLADAPRKIKWSGGECPVDCQVIAWLRNGFVKIEEAHAFDWDHAASPFRDSADDIIAYMVLPE